MSQLSEVQTWPSSQFSAAPGVHAPLLHVSPEVQTEPSASHPAPSCCATKPHKPVNTLHTDFAQVVSLLASQTTIVLAETTHLYGALLRSHMSVPLHGLPSSLTAQSLSFLHSQALTPETHLPPPHASPTVQGRPSSQVAVLLACVQPFTGSHASSVQTLLSLQIAVAAIARPTHEPPWQVSPGVHLLPSSQAT